MASTLRGVTRAGGPCAVGTALLLAVAVVFPTSGWAQSCTKWGSLGPDIFNGCKRRASKTRLVPLSQAPAETFPSIAALRASLPKDSEMRSLDPEISSKDTSERVSAELRNVKVYAVVLQVVKEDDRDYHVIVGDPGCASPRCLMNVEVSALPKDQARRASFRKVRAQLLDVLEGHEPSSSYREVQGQARVRIDGSLFYDIDHAPGASGPAGWRPDTSWEIHPVRRVKRLP